MPEPALNAYRQQVQRLLGFDGNQDEFNPDDLTEFINIARDQVAMQGQCVRYTPPYSGSVLSLQVVSPGSGYTSPTLAISPPDIPNAQPPYPRGLQATGIAQQIGGQISTAGVITGGAGYYAPPIVTVNDPTGTGAVIVANVSPVNTTTVGQEVYYFRDLNLDPGAGIRSIFAVLSITIGWGQYQWSTLHCSFSKYQAIVRQFTINYFAPPTVSCQYQQGVDGSFFLYPIANQPYPMTWDCLALPLPLTDPTSFEAIPDPWRNAVPYYAAHLALLAKSAKTPAFLNLANAYFNEKTGGLFGTMMKRARAFSQPGYRSGSFYGRGW